ncbi:LOW QUALITY PROTEIN: uncharacterized protein LOC9309555 [Arabidopsis lyrata subsp. lyrata]|uniref:LOW QUALITY PROTEIN: uncharacterized protein LOC9309555 n=1 Tax=Arabidopsis lyrata subsp. lyrata TaxID=81972 RepID=UPI000A29DD98|nr:LOW QUALITY PROTEIN: uncharacterized protein LOC9309555 [Arabidopsis lyrata subsp. lyrata]|eukprot:XP_002873487.2 LOW QUALITY PROTEIN: uncharacterized protein LOC9309555 [Arabidopsis lyrata subsp. lyrata]
MLLDSLFILGFFFKISLFNHHFSLSLYREIKKAADTCMLCMKERENSSTYELSQLSTSKGESKLCRLHLNPWNKIGFVAKSLELMCSNSWAL